MSPSPASTRSWAEFESHWIGREVEGEQYKPAELAFFRAILEGVLAEQAEVDVLIDRALQQGWPLRRVEAVLRAILRAGAFELMSRKDVPARVAIVEYTDIAGAFFDGEEVGMVNAVMDTLARRPAAGRTGGCGVALIAIRTAATIRCGASQVGRGGEDHDGTYDRSVTSTASRSRKSRFATTPARTASVITWGAVLRDLVVPGAGGLQRVVLGLNSLDDYRAYSPHFGATPGRFANRIAGGLFTLDGKSYSLPTNEKGKNTLHGRPEGFRQAALGSSRAARPPRSRSGSNRRTATPAIPRGGACHLHLHAGRAWDFDRPARSNDRRGHPRQPRPPLVLQPRRRARHPRSRGDAERAVPDTGRR